MGKQEELKLLQQKAVAISMVQDPDKRHNAGKQLEQECRSLDEQYRIISGIDPDAEVQLMATIKIVFDHILHDCREEDHGDWQYTESPLITKGTL